MSLLFLFVPLGQNAVQIVAKIDLVFVFFKKNRQNLYYVILTIVLPTTTIQQSAAKSLTFIPLID